MKGKNLEGQVFDRLTVENYSHSNNAKFWNCTCICGNSKIVRSGDLIKGNVRSCGCLFNEKQYDRCTKRLEFGESSFNALIRLYKTNAKKRKMDWNLSKNEARTLFKGNCYYCNIEPNQKIACSTAHGYFIYNGIDRKDNKLGYILNNCLSCCKYCNYAKRERSHDDFLNWVKQVYNNTND